MLVQLSRAFVWLILYAGALAALGAASLCVLLWYVFYWSHHECIRNSIDNGGNGCYVEAEEIVYHGNSEVMIYFAPLFLLPAAGFWLLGNAVRRYKIV